MANGIAKAKARRSAKKDRTGINARRKAGMPAKAGRRKPGGGRKAKSWSNIGRGYIMRNDPPKELDGVMVFREQWVTGQSVMVNVKGA